MDTRGTPDVHQWPREVWQALVQNCCSSQDENSNPNQDSRPEVLSQALKREAQHDIIRG